jgi:hypothetical protein
MGCPASVGIGESRLSANRQPISCTFTFTETGIESALQSGNIFLF